MMAVCTNKTEAFSRKLSTRSAWRSLFAAICGQDTFAFRKPDPRHLDRNHRAWPAAIPAGR